MIKPKILIFDIETSPIMSYTWGIWDQNVALNQIHTDWSILSWAAMWADDSKIMYMDNRKSKDVYNDKKLLRGIWQLINEADIIITQNGKSFDEKKLNARFILNGMKPPRKPKHFDTKRIATKYFAFTSNKLEYLTEKLCKKHKKLTGKRKFPGFMLWKECLKGNNKAWDELKHYNIADVTSLFELFGILSPWDSSINFGVYSDDEDHTCSCGSKKFKSNGFAYTATGKFQRYVCKSCGKESRSRQNLLSKEKTKSMRVSVR